MAQRGCCCCCCCLLQLCVLLRYKWSHKHTLFVILLSSGFSSIRFRLFPKLIRNARFMTRKTSTLNNHQNQSHRALETVRKKIAVQKWREKLVENCDDSNCLRLTVVHDEEEPVSTHKKKRTHAHTDADRRSATGNRVRAAAVVATQTTTPIPTSVPLFFAV